jgi:hypothetical protein
MGRRVAAWVVDSAIVLAPSLVVLSRDFQYRRESALQQDGFADTADFCEAFMDRTDGVCFSLADRAYFADNNDITAAPWLVGLGIAILIYVLIQGLRGWTPGKLLFGIRTVAGDGQPPGIGRAIIRWLLLVVDTLCAGLVGFIVALTSTGHRRVGDMAARTVVVGKEYAGQPIVVPGMTPSYAAYPGPPAGPGTPPGPWAPGGGRGGPPGSQPGEPPGTWGPPPAWGPAPTWGAPPAEATPPQTPAPETGAATGGTAPAGWSVPGGEAGPAEPASVAPAPEPADGAAATPDAASAEKPERSAETSVESPAGAAATDEGTPGYNPQWDPARGTYIVWSPDRGHWLGWDDTAKEWKAL